MTSSTLAALLALALFAVCLYLAHRAFRFCGAQVAVLTNLRIPAGMVLMAAAAGLRVLDLAFASGAAERRHVLAALAAFAAGWASVLYAISPPMWAGGLAALVDAVEAFASHPHKQASLFQGWIVSPAEIPAQYFPVWFAVSTPPVLLALSLAGFAIAMRRGGARPGAAGPPDIAAYFDVRIHDGQPIYARAGCAPREDLAARFFRRIDPVDPADLPEDRRRYGFDNRDFAPLAAAEGGPWPSLRPVWIRRGDRCPIAAAPPTIPSAASAPASSAAPPAADTATCGSRPDKLRGRMDRLGAGQGELRSRIDARGSNTHRSEPRYGSRRSAGAGTPARSRSEAPPPPSRSPPQGRDPDRPRGARPDKPPIAGIPKRKNLRPGRDAPCARGGAPL